MKITQLNKVKGMYYINEELLSFVLFGCVWFTWYIITKLLTRNSINQVMMKFTFIQTRLLLWSKYEYDWHIAIHKYSQLNLNLISHKKTK